MSVRKKKEKVQETAAAYLAKLELIPLPPKTANQKSLIKKYLTNKSLVIYGPPGTGKTLLPLYYAIKDIQEGKYERIVIFRSVVPTRNMGYLPGSEQEKAKVFELPYMQLVNFIFDRGDAYSILKQKDLLEFSTTSFIRGITINNSILIVDEAQNMSFHEINSLTTRVGDNCKIIFCGDSGQTDLRSSSGFDKLKEVVAKLPNWFEVQQFGVEDIVRSGLVKDWIKVLYE